MAGDDVPDDDLTQDPADTGVPSSQASPADEAADESDCVPTVGESTATLQDFIADVAAFFAKVFRGKTTVGSTTATAASAITTKGSSVPDSAAVAPEILCVSLDSITELPSDMRIALKRGDANMSVSDAVAQPVEQPVEGTCRKQPRRTGLMLKRWPNNSMQP